MPWAWFPCDLSGWSSAFKALRRGVETHGCPGPFRLRTATQIAREPSPRQAQELWYTLPCLRINIRSTSTISNPGTRPRFTFSVLDTKIVFTNTKAQVQDQILSHEQDQDHEQYVSDFPRQGLKLDTYKDYKRFDPYNKINFLKIGFPLNT